MTVDATETGCNKGRETAGLQLLINMAKDFYSSSENRKDFEIWKANKALKKESVAKEGA